MLIFYFLFKFLVYEKAMKISCQFSYAKTNKQYFSLSKCKNEIKKRREN